MQQETQQIVQQPAIRKPVFGLVQVSKVRDITPHMRRITFGGTDIRLFSSYEPGIHLKILLPQKGQSRPVLPLAGEDGMFRYPDEAERPVMRTYTLRSYDHTAQEMDIDFVNHGDEGPASAWANHAKPGDYLGIGIKGGRVYADASWYLLAGDQTALPAIAAILESLPPSAQGQALIEVPDASEEQSLYTASGVNINWIYRGDEPAGKSRLLLEAILRTPIPESGEQSRFVWLAGEAELIKTLKPRLVYLNELDKHELYASIYWRLGLTEDQR